MQYRVNKGFVKHQGALYGKGTLFDADPGDVLLLVKSGKVTEQTPLNPGHIPLLEGKDTFVLPSPDDFSKLSAEKQKELLKELEVEPASNPELRMEQFSEIYEQAIEEDGV